MTDQLTCIFCNAPLTEADEVELHGDICHDCAWGQTGSSKYHARQQKREGRPFTFNSNNHHTGCTCQKCKVIEVTP